MLCTNASSTTDTHRIDWVILHTEAMTALQNPRVHDESVNGYVTRITSVAEKGYRPLSPMDGTHPNDDRIYHPSALGLNISPNQQAFAETTVAANPNISFRNASPRSPRSPRFVHSSGMPEDQQHLLAA